MKQFGFVALLAIAVLASCAQPTAQESAELTERAQAWVEQYNAGDIDGVVGLYTDDARLLPPNAETMQGHDAIRAAFQALKEVEPSCTLGTLEAMTAGDLGYRVGTFTCFKADGSAGDAGKYIELWRRIDGVWRITHDMFSSDLPSRWASGTLLMGSHEVEDAAVWLAAWEDEAGRRAQFAANGAPGVRVFQSPENANLTGLLIDVHDMAAFQAFLDSEEGAAAKAEDGVKDETLRVLVEVE